MPPSTPAGLKQSRLRFTTVPQPASPRLARAASSKDIAGDMGGPIDAALGDGPVAPAMRSEVAVVIYTPNKTRTVQYGDLGHLPAPSQDPRAQSQASPVPHRRRSGNRGYSTPVQQPRPKRNGPRRVLPRSCKESARPYAADPNNPSDGSGLISTSSERDSPAEPSLHDLTESSVMDSASEDVEESEGSESPSRNRRSINPRSFLAGGLGGNPPLSSPRPSTPKRPRLSKDQAAQGRSKKSSGKSRPKSTVARSNPRSTRSRAKLGLSMASQEVGGGDSPAARKKSWGLERLPALKEHTGEASARKLGKRPAEQDKDDDNDDDDGDVILRSKRRRTRLGSILTGSGRGRGNGRGDEEMEDGEEASAGPRTRNRGATAKPKMTRKQKLLEELKSRRAGLSSAKDATLSSSSETFETPKRGIYDTETENESTFPDDERDDDSGTEAIRKSLQGGWDKGYDSDFVVSDNDGNIGAPSLGPGRLDIPIQFTFRAHKKLKEHFSDAIEWMVHNKLNPAFDRHDPVYRVAFQRLSSEAATYSSSKFESSAWAQGFTRALRARPEFCKQSITLSNEDCEACNRKNHTATYKVQFGGKPYHHKSLEEISSFSEDGDEDGSSGNEHDSQGHSLPDKTTSYYLGRVCCLNAETAHALTHWRYHLNEWVVDELHRQRLFDPNAILNRESWNTKRRSAYADSIMQQLQESGEISRLYRDFKNNLTEARNVKPSRWTK
ncbi:MAG: hypothetical protein M1839_007231 [Geoglossum umbratile]|nr:MAG: hypothetical protein M1839_007231 [Geoglossum umbratile]